MHPQYKWCFDKKSLESQYFFIKLCTNLIDEDGCLAEYVRECARVYLGVTAVQIGHELGLTSGISGEEPYLTA